MGQELRDERNGNVVPSLLKVPSDRLVMDMRVHDRFAATTLVIVLNVRVESLPIL